jgi:hypothetical protein
MKSKEQRYLELYEQVKTLVEVSETEARLAKLFPQTNYQVGSKGAKQLEALKKKNIGKNGKYHSVIKMKRSSVVSNKQPEQEQVSVETGLNDGTMSPEETIRGMQDPSMVAQDLISRGAAPEEVVQQLISQGVSEEEATSIVQQLTQQE